jgi:hypothetical protein
VTHTKKQNNRNNSVESRAESAAFVDCCMQTRVCKRERESTKRGEGNLMGWIVMKKVGTKLASEKLSPSERGRGGRKDGGKKGWKSGWSLQPKKKTLNFFSARVCVFFFVERDCEIHSGSKEHMHCRRKKQSKEVYKLRYNKNSLSLSLFLSLSIWENWGCDFCCWLSIF